MGLMDRFRGKSSVQEEEKQGKYSEQCALCGEHGTDKKWMGQYWHKKCWRKSRKFARGMV
jgi:hypothetical protein